MFEGDCADMCTKECTPLIGPIYETKYSLKVVLSSRLIHANWKKYLLQTIKNLTLIEPLCLLATCKNNAKKLLD
jgi:hypothetical protein